MRDADDPAAHDERGLEDDGLLGGLLGEEVHRDQRQRDDDDDEELENALDPHVDDPPAPELGGDDVGLGRVEEARDEQQADRAARVDDHVGQPVAGLAVQQRFEPAGHEGGPAQEADQQAELPDAADLEVLEAPRCPAATRAGRRRRCSS